MLLIIESVVKYAMYALLGLEILSILILIIVSIPLIKKRPKQKVWFQ